MTDPSITPAEVRSTLLLRREIALLDLRHLASGIGKSLLTGLTSASRWDENGS